MVVWHLRQLVFVFRHVHNLQREADMRFSDRIANAMGWVPNEEYYYQHRDKK